MAQLPQDLITEILTSSPVKTLLRFRCVSKSLCSIIDSSDFIKLHASNNKTHRKIILGDINRLNLTNGVPLHVFDMDDDLSPPGTFHNTLHGSTTSDNGTHPKIILGYTSRLNHTSGVQIGVFDIDDDYLSPFWHNTLYPRPTHTVDLFPSRVLAHCNGLVVLEVDFFCLVVWNPSMQRCSRLPLLPGGVPIDRDHTRIKGLCFGYDFSIDDYKVFLIEERWLHYNPGNAIWISGLRWGYWRRIEIPHNLYLITGKFKNCYVDGAFYFSCLNDVIFSFDLANETFSKVCFPDCDQPPHTRTNLQVVEGYLCVGFLSWEKPFELYARKKNDAGDYSWIKFFSITYPQPFSTKSGVCLYDLLKTGEVLGFLKDGNKIFVCNQCIVYSCDLKKKNIKMIVQGDQHNHKAFFCIESLVWIDVEEKDRERESKKT